MQIEGVPESITRVNYWNLIESVGFDPATVKEIRFTTDGVFAMVVPAGGLKRDSDGEPMYHSVFIPVVGR